MVKRVLLRHSFRPKVHSVDRMDLTTTSFETFVASATVSLNEWMATVYPDQLVGAVLVCALLVGLRRKIAALGLKLLRQILDRFSVSLRDEVNAQLRSASEILVSAFALFAATQLLVPDGVAKLLLERIMGSVAIIAVFGAWYRLSGPFAALLWTDKLSLVPSETGWVQRVMQFAILLFGLTSLLRVWQVDISGALTGVGVLGAGLAIAAQDLVRNLVAGMTNISEKRFETGDTIAVGGDVFGTVEAIDLRSTKIVGFDQIPRHIPNSDLANATVLNYSRLKRRRVYLKVPLVLSSTQQQIEAVRDGIRDYHLKSGDFDTGDGAPKYIYVNELGPSSVDIIIYAWTKGPTWEELLQVTERLTLAILRITRDAETELAYPTQSLHLQANGDAKSLKISDITGAYD